jgi:hypothetical protein
MSFRSSPGSLSGFAAKRLKTIAQGFYEADLVKGVLQKKVFLRFGVFRTSIRQQLNCGWLFGA